MLHRCLKQQGPQMYLYVCEYNGAWKFVIAFKFSLCINKFITVIGNIPFKFLLQLHILLPYTNIENW